MRALLVALLAGALLLNGCRPAPEPVARDPRATAPLPTAAADDGAAATRTLRWAIAEPAGITPATATSADGQLIVDALFDSLTRVDPQGRPRPAAAWSWVAQPDAATWTFRLRSNAVWHDGTPVTAQDFVDGWSEAVRRDLTAFHLADVEGYEEVRSGAAQTLSGVTALDPRTLQVQLRRPRADFPVVVGHPSLGPTHRSSLALQGIDLQPIGNGPYRMAEAWVREQFVRLVPAERWSNGSARPQVQEVVFRIMDPDAAFVAFQQGRVDVARVPPTALDRAIEQYGEAPGDGYAGPGVLRGDVPVLYHLAFDLDQPPYDDPAVRRAVSLAIDRRELARAVLQGNVRPAHGVVPPAIPGSRLLTCGACRHAPREARELFADLGISTLTLWFNPDGGHGQVAQRVRTDLAEVGVAVRFEAPDGAGFAAAVREGRAGWFRAGWAAEHLSLHDALNGLLHSNGPGNLGGYSAPDVDALLEQAAAELDRALREPLLQRAEDLAIGRDQAIVPLFTYRLDLVVSERVVELRVDPLRRVDLSTVRLAGGA